MEVAEADEPIEDEADVPLQEQEVGEEIGGKM
jgi:hypothetical protein